MVILDQYKKLLIMWYICRFMLHWNFIATNKLFKPVLKDYQVAKGVFTLYNHELYWLREK